MYLVWMVRWRILLVLSTWILHISLTEASSSSGSSNNDGSTGSYTSVRALDQFGHSIQLKHAREAAHRFGRLVVAASDGNETVMVVSIGNRPMLQSITLKTITNDHGGQGTQQTQPQRQPHLALCCTGVKGDANWLITHVQEYVAQVWERYNTLSMEPFAVAHHIARLLGSFEDEDWDQEWQSSLRRESEKWARPLGIQTMILSTKSPHILLLEPSGRVLSSMKLLNGWVGVMGKGSDIAHEYLSRIDAKSDKTVLEVSEMKDIIIMAVIETLSRNDTIEIMVEIMTPDGIERRRVEVKNGKQISDSVVSS